jgi:hypothetical protein
MLEHGRPIANARHSLYMPVNDKRRCMGHNRDGYYTTEVYIPKLLQAQQYYSTARDAAGNLYSIGPVTREVVYRCNIVHFVRATESIHSP